MEPETSRITVVNPAKLAAESTIHNAPRKEPDIPDPGSLLTCESLRPLVMGDTLLPTYSRDQSRFRMATLRGRDCRNIL